jgi:hypothetical protein
MTVTLLPPLELALVDPLLLLLLLLEPHAPSAETATRQLAIASQRDAKVFPPLGKPVKGPRHSNPTTRTLPRR